MRTLHFVVGTSCFGDADVVVVGVGNRGIAESLRTDSCTFGPSPSFAAYWDQCTALVAWASSFVVDIAGGFAAFVELQNCNIPAGSCSDPC